VIFWHVGASVALARYGFRDDHMDLRMLALGALLPDIVDTPVGLVLYGRLGSVRLVTHGLLLATAVMAVVVLATRRGRSRKFWMPVAIGLLLHLTLDAMWTDPETLWWPVLGWEFSRAGAVSAGEYVAALPGSVWIWVREAVGLAYLTYLWRAAGISDPKKRRTFLTTGRVDVPIEGRVNC